MSSKLLTNYVKEINLFYKDLDESAVDAAAKKTI